MWKTFKRSVTKSDIWLAFLTFLAFMLLVAYLSFFFLILAPMHLSSGKHLDRSLDPCSSRRNFKLEAAYKNELGDMIKYEQDSQEKKRQA